MYINKLWCWLPSEGRGNLSDVVISMPGTRGSTLQVQQLGQQVLTKAMR